MVIVAFFMGLTFTASGCKEEKKATTTTPTTPTKAGTTPAKTDEGSITIEDAVITLAKDKEATATVKVKGKVADLKDLKVSDAKIAVAVDGDNLKLTAQKDAKVGDATITAKDAKGKDVKGKVTVKAAGREFAGQNDWRSISRAGLGHRGRLFFHC